MTETLREKGSWLDRCWVLFVATRLEHILACRCCRPAPSEPRVPPALCRSPTVGPRFASDLTQGLRENEKL